MIIRALVVLLAIAAGVSQAAADERIRSVVYSKDRVYQVYGRAGYQMTVTFGPDEYIENVAVGDSLAWQVTPNKRANLLFIKPVQMDARTNMTVVTDKRIYLFDLVPSQEGGPAPYAIRFKYPGEPSAAPASTVASSAKADASGADLDFAWTKKGAARLYPQYCYDDGRSIYLRFDKSQKLPAILALDEKGTEGPVGYLVRGDTIIVNTMTKQLVLRSGRDRAVLTKANALKAASPSSKSLQAAEH